MTTLIDKTFKTIAKVFMPDEKRARELAEKWIEQHPTYTR
jgi:hypothetical protein